MDLLEAVPRAEVMGLTLTWEKNQGYVCPSHDRKLAETVLGFGLLASLCGCAVCCRYGGFGPCFSFHISVFLGRESSPCRFLFQWNEKHARTRGLNFSPQKV